MDKETLSNYGWIVICVIVLAVMIALATPFATAIKDAVIAAVNRLTAEASEALGQVDAGQGSVGSFSFDTPNFTAGSSNP
mgnify:CR=1 FL=1